MNLKQLTKQQNNLMKGHLRQAIDALHMSDLYLADYHLAKADKSMGSLTTIRQQAIRQVLS